MSRSKVVTVSALMISALAFTACGGSSGNDEGASSKESTPEVNVDSAPAFVDAYEQAFADAKITEDHVPSTEVSNIISSIDLTGISDPADLEKEFANLTDEQKKTLKTYFQDEGADPLYKLTDTSDMSEEQVLVNSFLNFIAAFDLDGKTIDPKATELKTEDVKLDGEKAELPAADLDTAISDENMKKLFGSIEAKYVDGEWKIDGKSTYDRVMTEPAV